MTISRNHPVRVLLDLAAHGRPITKRELDHNLIQVGEEYLPDGHNLDRFRTAIAREAENLAATYNTGNHAAAARAAEQTAANLAARMTPQERALNTTATTDSKRDIDDMVARIFDN